jgi:hypothetical protein
LGYRGYKVLNPDSYLDAVVADLNGQGLCAAMDFGRQNLNLKKTNDSSELFQILQQNSFIVRRYLQTCVPAAFPITAEEAIDHIRVGFYGFRCPPGIVPPAPPLGLLLLGCEGLATATPKDRANKDIPAYVHGTEIAWNVRLGDDLIAVYDFPDQPFNKVIRSQGLGYFSVCATVKGVEGCLNGRIVRP